jgi:hypothetical protein
MAELVEVVVNPHQLLLDPNNPRLFDRPIERAAIASDQIDSEEMQSKLLAEIGRAKHGLDDIVYSIQAQGFVNLDTLLVKPLNGTEKYLVLEGNRRTAAIKLLLASTDVDQDTKDSLKNLAVKELKLSKGEDEEEEIQKIISMRHLAGPRQWSPIARASAIYQNYMLQHKKIVGGPMNIIVDKVLARTSQIIGMPKPQLRHAMGVFAIYKELADAGFQVKAEHFSLLELLVRARAMASEYFGFNSNQLTVYDDGLEKINDFFVDENRIVRNPQDFNKIKRVFMKGTIEELDLIRSGIRNVDNIIRDIKGRAKDSSFADALKGVKDTLENLPISAFRDTDSEALAVMSLKRLIDQKFLPIAHRHLGIDQE